MRHGSGALVELANRSDRLNTLKQRLITAALLALTTLAAFIFLPTGMVALVLGVFGALGAWEWAALVGWPSARARLAYVTACLALLMLAYWLLQLPWVGAGITALVSLWLLGWAVIFYWVIAYQRGRRTVPRSRTLQAGIGLLVMVSAWSALVVLHGSFGGGVYLLISLMLLVWGADTAAFFVGRRWGKHRLADRISPGKTWEGFLGALAATVGIAWICSAPLGLAAFERLLFLLLCLVTVAFSVLGDLLESLLKRLAGVKDSSALLPGHGGILDRIDSMLAAAPVFAIGVSILRIYS
ncbi:MAG TPA: phosphatidate cytidylyltransferase [Gammaproteobacteria bacterium]|nr:phosphatidate cytidylyltransferase [Gammaproteobacteria bacterium]